MKVKNLLKMVYPAVGAWIKLHEGQTLKPVLYVNYPVESKLIDERILNAQVTNIVTEDNGNIIINYKRSAV